MVGIKPLVKKNKALNDYFFNLGRKWQAACQPQRLDITENFS